ncbi:hypothetical protein [Streptomyces agglomeratus]|uniref:hypothetical protein n=1 Tax=Streptomyces agglomeratus TaxID=285458 RepID=UPI00114CA265|nr:hypothetical protein [Streptomyces agglomeratus]
MRRTITAAAMAAAALTLGSVSAAQAADGPKTPNLGGVAALGGEDLGNRVDGAAQRASNLAGDVGSKTVKKGVPAAGKVVGKSAKMVAPAK